MHTHVCTLCVCVCTLCVCVYFMCVSVCVSWGGGLPFSNAAKRYISLQWELSLVLIRGPTPLLLLTTSNTHAHTRLHTHTYTRPPQSSPSCPPPLSTLLIDIPMLSIWLTKGCVCVYIRVCTSVYCYWWRVFFRAVRGRDWAILRGP